MASCPKLMGGGGLLLELRSLGNSWPKEGASRPREGVSPSRSAAGGVKGRRIWSSEQLVDGELRSCQGSCLPGYSSYILWWVLMWFSVFASSWNRLPGS